MGTRNIVIESQADLKTVDDFSLCYACHLLYDAATSAILARGWMIFVYIIGPVSTAFLTAPMISTPCFILLPTDDSVVIA